MHQRSTLTDAYELFILDCESRGFTPDTVRFYRDRFRLIQRWCAENGVDTLDKLTSLAIRQYLAGLVTTTRVLEAESLRIVSHTNHDNAIFDASLAAYRLARAVGEL